VKNYTTPLGLYQHLPINHWGGHIAYADYCPVTYGYGAGGDCRIPANAEADSDLTESSSMIFGPDSRCFRGNLLLPTATVLPAQFDTRCYRHSCSNGGLIITVGNHNVTCPVGGGNMTVPGYSGWIVCPDSRVLCNPIADTLPRVTTSTPTTTLPITTKSPTNTPTPTSEPTVTPTATDPHATTTTPSPTVPQSESPTATQTTSSPTPQTTIAPTITTGKLEQRVSGDNSTIPQPIVPNSLVLYTSSSATVSLTMVFTNDITIPKESVIQSTMVTFNVSYLSAQAIIAVVVSDDYGERAGNVTVQVSTTGMHSVELKDIITALVNTYQRGFVLRAISGNVLRMSLETLTQNVAINVVSDVSTSVTMYQQTSSPTQTPIVTTPTPTATQAPKDPGPFYNNTPMWIAIALSLTVIGGLLITGVVLLVIGIIRARRNKLKRPVAVELENHELDDTSTSYVRLTE
jgi:hypothetical protein